jgi:hypothetical protein
MTLLQIGRAWVVRGYDILHGAALGRLRGPTGPFSVSTGDLTSGKQAGVWSWPFTPPSDEDKNQWSSKSTPPHVFMMCYGTTLNQRGLSWVSTVVLTEVSRLSAVCSEARSQNCEKETINACLSVLPSLPVYILPHEITRLPHALFSWNTIFEYFSKTCRETSRLV